MATHEWIPEEKLEIWEKARKIVGLDSREWRLDPCGDKIRWTDYGSDESPYGWEIDHVIQQARLEAYGVPDNLIHHLRNLRPMQTSNNTRKSDDYHAYSSANTVNGCEVCRDYEVNNDLQRDLYYLYGEYFNRSNQALRNLPEKKRQWIDQIFGTLPSQDREWLARVMGQYSIDFPDKVITPNIYDLD